MTTKAQSDLIRVKMLVLKPGEDEQRIEVDLSPTYKGLSKVLEPILGGDLEHVAVWADFSGGENYERLDMFVNDVGAISDPQLPRNEEATTIYRRATMVGMSGLEPPRDPEEMPAIYGPAVLFNTVVWR